MTNLKRTKFILFSLINLCSSLIFASEFSDQLSSQHNSEISNEQFENGNNNFCLSYRGGGYVGNGRQAVEAGGYVGNGKIDNCTFNQLHVSVFNSTTPYLQYGNVIVSKGIKSLDLGPKIADAVERSTDFSKGESVVGFRVLNVAPSAVAQNGINIFIEATFNDGSTLNPKLIVEDVSLK